MAADPKTSAVFELGGFEFGHSRGRIHTYAWDLGTQDLQTQDVELDGRVLVGRDDPVPPLWRFGFLTRLGLGEAGAHEEIARLAAVWRPDALRYPGEDVPLRYFLAGRWRRVYGRPRTMVLPSTDLVVMQGQADFVGEFRLTDVRHYDDVEQTSGPIAGVPPSSGGIVAPLVAPISTTRTGDTAYRFITVGGDVPTPLRVTFAGPDTNPWITVGGVRVALTGSIAFDQTVTVDARARTVLRQDGASVAGMLSRRTRMDRLLLRPGTHEIRYGGTGQATVTVSWRDAWRTL